MKGRSSNQITGFIQKPIDCLCSQNFSPRQPTNALSVDRARSKSVHDKAWPAYGDRKRVYLNEWRGSCISIDNLLVRIRDVVPSVSEPYEYEYVCQNEMYPQKTLSGYSRKQGLTYDSVTLAVDRAIAKLSFKQH